MEMLQSVTDVTSCVRSLSRRRAVNGSLISEPTAIIFSEHGRRK
jgi:hypothetical protein